jgi:hypothetical protein
MQVVLKTRQGTRGEVRLEGGRAVGSNARTRRLLEQTEITEPGTLKTLEPSDGDRYLRALPDNLSGAYLLAVRVDC